MLVRASEAKEEGKEARETYLSKSFKNRRTPERFFGHENDEFTDQYSLGIIATELLGSIPKRQSRIWRTSRCDTRPSDSPRAITRLQDLPRYLGEDNRRAQRR